MNRPGMVPVKLDRGTSGYMSVKRVRPVPLKDEVEHLRVVMGHREETHAEEIRRRDHLLTAALF